MTAAQSERAADRSAGGGRPLRVLCVDDDPDIRTLVEIGLGAAGGFMLCLCSSGGEALAAAEAFDPDLALLDLRMPGIDGLELRRRLEARPGRDRCRVIFLTAATKAPELAQLAAGGAEIITKPFDPMSLAGRIRAAVE